MIDLNYKMKSYLNDFNIHGNSRPSSTKMDLDRQKNKSQKSTLRHKNELRSLPQSHNSISTHNNQKSKQKSIKRTQQNSQPMESKFSSKHGRTHTDTQLEPYNEDRPGSGFGKTLSRRHLKTEFGNYNGETMRVIKKETKTVKMEDNFVTGLVKARLQLQKKQKKGEKSQIQRITELIQEVKGKGYRNPQEGEDSRNSRRSMEQGFQSLYERILQEKDHSQRQQALCELVRVLLTRIKHGQSNEQSQRLVRVVRQLEQRNVRLMRLINYMKGRGIDVDQYWNESALS